MTTTNALDLELGLPASVVCDRLRLASDHNGCNKRILAFFLVEMEDRKLFAVGPHGSTEHFGESQLEMSHRRVREYIQIGRTLNDLVLLDEAFLAGEIGWAKVIAMLPVVQRSTQESWVEFAKTHNWRDVRVEVRASRPGQIPGEGDGYAIAAPHVLLQAKLDDTTFKMLEEARVRLSDGGQLPSDEELILELLRRFLHGDSGSNADREDAQEQTEETRNDEELPSLTRAEVLHRDEHRCQNCRGRYPLHLHHIRPRALGGSNLTCNLVVLCESCHASVHRGFLRLSGNPDRGLRFMAIDGTPLDRQHHGVHTPDPEVTPGRVAASAPCARVARVGS